MGCDFVANFVFGEFSGLKSHRGVYISGIVTHTAVMSWTVHYMSGSLLGTDFRATRTFMGWGLVTILGFSEIHGFMYFPACIISCYFSCRDGLEHNFWFHQYLFPTGGPSVRFMDNTMQAVGFWFMTPSLQAFGRKPWLTVYRPYSSFGLLGIRYS